MKRQRVEVRGGGGQGARVCLFASTQGSTLLQMSTRRNATYLGRELVELQRSESRRARAAEREQQSELDLFRGQRVR